MSVAEHSYVTAVIVMLMKGAGDTPDMLKAALLHDIEEGFTGDLNALAKRMDNGIGKAWKRLKRLTMENIVLEDAPPEWDLIHFWGMAQNDVLLKAADIVSMWLYCIEEVDLGNNSMRHVCYIAENWLWKLKDEHDWLEPWVAAIATENAFREIHETDVPASLHYVLNA